MKYEEIKNLAEINDLEPKKVREIADSIRDNGWIGCPILVYGEELLTGSHRLAALQLLEEEGVDVWDMDVAEDVTEIVEENMARYEEENGWVPDIDKSSIGWLLKGSWVEQYKQEIVEW